MTYVNLPLEKIQVARNGRTKADQVAIEQLAESIGKVGLINPVTVRMTGDVGKEVGYALVAGHRRLAAYRLLGKIDIEARAWVMTDAEAAVLQLVENVQREDVHPMDEADAFRALERDHGLPAEEIAARTGKKIPFVRQRLCLSELTGEFRKAVRADKISLAIGLAVARLPESKSREECAAEILKRIVAGHTLEYDEVVDIVEEGYHLSLGSAPFSIISDTLLPKAGSCTLCPKRAGNAADLFGDVAKDTCTDRACFRAKKDAHWAATKLAAEKTGKKVMPDGTTRKVFPYTSDTVGSGSGYVSLDGEAYEVGDGNRSWRGILAGTRVDVADIVVARAPSGRAIELLPKARALELAKAAGVKPNASAVGGSRSDAEKREADKRRKQRDALDAVIAAVVARAHTAEVPAVLSLLALAGAQFDATVLREISRRRGIKVANSSEATTTWRTWIRSAHPGEDAEAKHTRLLGFVLEVAMLQLAGKYGAHVNPEVRAAASLVGINVDKLPKPEAVPGDVYGALLKERAALRQKAAKVKERRAAAKKKPATRTSKRPRGSLLKSRPKPKPARARRPRGKK